MWNWGIPSAQTRIRAWTHPNTKVKLNQESVAEKEPTVEQCAGVGLISLMIWHVKRWMPIAPASTPPSRAAADEPRGSLESQSYLTIGVPQPSQHTASMGRQGFKLSLGKPLLSYLLECCVVKWSNSNVCLENGSETNMLTHRWSGYRQYGKAQCIWCNFQFFK